MLPPNIIHFNTYFGENLEVDKKDGIDIYDVQSKEDILNFYLNQSHFAVIVQLREELMIIYGSIVSKK